MKRRDFLRTSAAAAAGLALSHPGLARGPAAGQKVIVVGAGLSGLVAAYELAKLGNEVRIIEAQAQTGGRVFTIRDFSEGLHAEAGAARIPADHDLTLKYAKEFELPLIPFYPSEGKFMRYNQAVPEAVDWRKFADATSFVMSLGKPEHWQKIKGGNDRLPAAFAARLAGRIRHGSPVVKIGQSAGKVTVSFKESQRIQTEECDRLICAVPLTMLSRIDVTPAFSQAKQDAIRSVRYTSASRFFIETKRRFWLDSKLNGFGFGDDSAEIWDSTYGQPGTRGILQRYMRGGGSSELIGRSEAERAEASLAKLSGFFPDVRSNFARSYSKCWSEDPWVLGAWGHLNRQHAENAKMPEGRIHFAGEHLSEHGSWMQGALESGLRVVSEITTTPMAARAV